LPPGVGDGVGVCALLGPCEKIAGLPCTPLGAAEGRSREDQDHGHLFSFDATNYQICHHHHHRHGFYCDDVPQDRDMSHSQGEDKVLHCRLRSMIDDDSVMRSGPSVSLRVLGWSRTLRAEKEGFTCLALALSLSDAEWALAWSVVRAACGERGTNLGLLLLLELSRGLRTWP
jgi:hypothetical protein